MKIAFPVEEDRGAQSVVYGHFGSASFFVVVETEANTVETLTNQEREHAHGQCQPLAALSTAVEAVVVGGIGQGALAKLRSSGVKVYRAVEGTVEENLDLVRSGRLPEFPREHTCAAHDSGEPCVH